MFPPPDVQLVAPYAGAWIEIPVHKPDHLQGSSHPTRVRGLKSVDRERNEWQQRVAPYAGAWIEIDRQR